jgi:flagellar protein FlaG
MTTSAVNPTSTFMADIATQEVKNIKVPNKVDSQIGIKSPDTIQSNTTSKDDLSNSVNEEFALKKAEQAVNDSLLSYFTEKISFEIDEKTRKTVIKIIDKESGEVVKQYPAQAFLDMVHALNTAAKLVLKDLPKYM